MSVTSQQRAEEFLKVAGQFKLGALVTESSHPITTNLSAVAGQDISAALDLLFQVDSDVVETFRKFVESRRAESLRDEIVRALKSGGRIFFTGCGSTGRLSILLDSVWREFWQGQKNPDLEKRTLSVMAGGDYALIKSVEGFEDFTAFGKKQIADLGVSAKDVVFAITEGGETSFVIGTAWQAVEVGAKVYFVYNNPDDILSRHVERSREVINDARIEKINLTTGPMAITGSTRMQATSIQLCVILTVLEMVVRELILECGGKQSATPLSNRQASSESGVAASLCHRSPNDSATIPAKFLAALEELHLTLRSPGVLSQLARIVALEESTYRSGHKNNYFADRFGIDVLTDTTERSPTYCTPPFRKFDDTTATESWAFLFLPDQETPQAWERILKRPPRCVGWSNDEVRSLVTEDKLDRTCEIIRKISRTELMRFKIGQDGKPFRALNQSDCFIAVISDVEAGAFEKLSRDRFDAAPKAGVTYALICFGDPKTGYAQPGLETVSISVPRTGFLLDGVTRVAVKLVMNALSTCTMVRLGRVMGNYMVWVVPSNLKLIDRATRYIEKLTGWDYERANHLLFEVIEYVEPRMKTDQAYPPVVGMAVLRARQGLSNEAAEQQLAGNMK